MENAAVGVKKLAEQAQSTIGKFSGLAGAATLAAAAIGTVAAAVIKWANAEEAAEKKAKKRAAERSARRVQTEADEARIDRENAALELEGRRTRDQTLIRRAQENAAEIERKAALREAEGASRGEVAGLRIKAEEARGTLPKGSMQDTVAAAAIQRQSRFEIAMIKAEEAAAARERRPDLVRATGEGKVQQLASELEMTRALAELRGTSERDALKLAEQRRDVRIAELELERKVLEATTATDLTERREIENRKAQIGRDIELANIEARIEARDIEIAKRNKANEIAIANIQAEGQATARVLDLDSARARRATERAKLDLEAASRAAALTGKREDLLAVERAESRLHELTIAQLDQEAAATLRMIDIREAEIRAREGAIPGIQHQAELEQVAHDRKMAMIDAEVAAMQAADAEKARLMANDQARVQQATAKIDEAIGTFESIQGSAMSAITDFMGRARAEQDEDLQEWRATLEARTAAQQEQLDKQIANARSNSNLVRELQQRKASLEKSTQKQIAAAEDAHNDRRKKAEMRFQGTMLLIQGAVSVARAASSYPNIPAMIAHGVAAGINFTYGAMLMAGKVPGGHNAGGAGGGGGSGATGTAPSLSDRGTTEVNRVPESVGGSAAERQGNRGRVVGGSNGNVTFMGDVTINALGSVDEDAAVKIGMAVNRGKYTREGAALK
jgi:hypothetical protein